MRVSCFYLVFCFDILQIQTNKLQHEKSVKGCHVFYIRDNIFNIDDYGRNDSEWEEEERGWW